MKNMESALKKTTSAAIYAMASSILTDLLLDFLLGSTYVGRYGVGQIEVSSQRDFAIWQILLLTFGVFGAIWLLLGIIVPKLLSLLSRLSYSPFRKHRRKDVITIFKNVREDIKRIDEVCSRDSFAMGFGNSFLFADLVRNTKLLTDVFTTPDNKRKLFKRSYFRTCVTIDDIERYISTYELLALVELMSNLLKKVYDYCPKDCRNENDLNQAQKRLVQLKKGFVTLSK